MAPNTAPPAAPMAPPLTVREAVVWPQPAAVKPKARRIVRDIDFMGLLPFPGLFAGPFGGECPNHPVDRRLAHVFLVLLIGGGPSDKGLDSLVPRGRGRVAEKALQILPV